MSPDNTAIDPASPRGLGPLRAVARTFGAQESGLLVVILAMVILLTVGGGEITRRDGTTASNFLRVDNVVANVATPMSWIAIMAVGGTMVIISGGIDLSVGSVMALAALGTAGVLQQPWFAEHDTALVVLPAALLVACGIGLACGFVNGLLVVLLRMHPFIVTLGTLYIFRGIALIAVPTKTVPVLGRTLPDALTERFIAARLGGEGSFIQPMPMVVMFIVVAAGWVFLSHTVWGRQIFAVGGNEEAARFSGLPVGWVKLRVYMLAGLTAGIAGVVNVGYYQSASTDLAQGYELLVIAAAVVGGASLLGGRGSALGALLGASVIALIENSIFILREINLGFATVGLKQEYAKIIHGIAIIIAVTIDRLTHHFRERRLVAAGRTQKETST